jgi:ATP-dependent RNA helicase RhlE
MLFTSLGLSEVLSQPLERLGYTVPTPVQTQAIPAALRGGDLMARAHTGTGKTAAFGLPMIDRLLVHRVSKRVPRAPRGLVLVPTRELAIQVERALVAYGMPVAVRTTSIIGGVGMGPQIAALRRGVDIIVATPGRLLDHMQQRTVDLSAVEIVTLDEADRMLDMGFLPSLRRILPATPAGRQTLLFSATLSPEVRRLAADFTRSASHIDVAGETAEAQMVSHRVETVADGAKGDALTRVLTKPGTGQALVFCKTKRRSDRVGQHLTRAGISAAVIHGNKSQGARNRAMRDFHSGRVNVLVATDIAARGLDIPQLPLVVNYDLPLAPEDYLHRVGRTGRAGCRGTAVSFVSSAERALLPGIRRMVAAPLEEAKGAITHDDKRATDTRMTRVSGGRVPHPKGATSATLLSRRPRVSTSVRRRHRDDGKRVPHGG